MVKTLLKWLMSGSKEMPNRRHRQGKKAEKEAEKLLKKKGHKILARNFHARQGEIDIISKHKDILVFTEVRSRTNKYYAPEASVDIKKQEKIRLAATVYLLQERIEDIICRFDVIAIVFENENIEKIEHYENAF